MALEKLNKNALQSFNKLEMPELKYGLGIFADITNLNLNDLNASNDKMEIIADKKVKIIDLAENGELADRYLKPEFDNKITSLHYSILNDAKLLIIPKDTVIEKPIIINSKLKSKSKSENIIIIAEENSKAAVIEVSESSPESYFKSLHVQIISKENSSVDYFTLQNLNENTYSFARKTGNAKKNSSINWTDIILGGKFGQVNIKTLLSEDGASTKKLGAFFGSGFQNFDLNAESVHEVHNTNSWMYHRGVLNDNSKAIYRGNVKINRNARNSIGHQKSDILLMGDNAKCDAVPVLDVDNDEVICSHGITLGQIDDEQIFYLTSRGLDETSAKKMIVTGFMEHVIKEVKDMSVREKIYNIIEEKLVKKVGIENE